MRIGAVILVALGGLNSSEAEACDSYSSRRVIGFSADGGVVVSRLNGEEPGPGAWIRLETHRLPSLVPEQRWDIVTEDELARRRTELKGVEWVPDNDPKIVKLRSARWRAVEAELTSKGFVIEPNRELPSQVGSGYRSFQLEALGGELKLEKATPYGDDRAECIHDLVLRVGQENYLVVSRAVTGCGVVGIPWFERAYLGPGKALLILVRRGACADPSMLVLSMERLARLTGVTRR